MLSSCGDSLKLEYAAESGERWPQSGFSFASQPRRACNINLLRCTPRISTRIAYSVAEGADLSPLRSGGGRVRVREGGHLPLLSLSQDCRTTGILGRMDAWRAWIGPPQGASDRSDLRPLPSPIRDRRNLPQSSTFAVQTPCPSWPVCWRVASFGCLFADLAARLRHILEDGVANAEAPSLFEGPAHRIFSYSCRSPASA